MLFVSFFWRQLKKKGNSIPNQKIQKERRICGFFFGPLLLSVVSSCVTQEVDEEKEEEEGREME